MGSDFQFPIFLFFHFLLFLTTTIWTYLLFYPCILSKISYHFIISFFFLSFFQKDSDSRLNSVYVYVCVRVSKELFNIEFNFFKRNRRGRRESLEDRRGVEAWSADPWTILTNRRPSLRRIRPGRVSVGPVGNRPEDTPSFRTGRPRRTVAGPSSPIPTRIHRTTTGTRKKRENEKKKERERDREKNRWKDRSVKANHPCVIYIGIIRLNRSLSDAKIKKMLFLVLFLNM